MHKITMGDPEQEQTTLETVSPAKTSQPDPIPNESTDIQSLVLADIAERRAHGIRTYGTPLQAYNGRDALQDLYEELLDAVMYVKQLMVERDNKNEELKTYVSGVEFKVNGW